MKTLKASALIAVVAAVWLFLIAQWLIPTLVPH